MASRTDSVAVCVAALRAAEREALGREPMGLLLMQHFVPPDTGLEHALLRQHAAAGICEVGVLFPNTCLNGVRGLTAWFEEGKPTIHRDWAFAWVRVRPMRAEGDETWLLEPSGRAWDFSLHRHGSTWVASIFLQPR